MIGFEEYFITCFFRKYLRIGQKFSKTVIPLTMSSRTISAIFLYIHIGPAHILKNDTVTESFGPSTSLIVTRKKVPFFVYMYIFNEIDNHFCFQNFFKNEINEVSIRCVSSFSIYACRARLCILNEGHLMIFFALLLLNFS